MPLIPPRPRNILGKSHLEITYARFEAFLSDGSSVHYEVHNGAARVLVEIEPKEEDDPPYARKGKRIPYPEIDRISFNVFTPHTDSNGHAVRFQFKEKWDG